MRIRSIKKILLVHNKKSGARTVTAEALLAEFAKHHIACEVVSPDGLDSRRLAASAQYDAVVAAGGDGTVSAAANALFRYRPDIPLGVVAVGTFNHFAKDAQLPLAVKDAVEAIAAGQVIDIDIASINGRAFVNNSSLGLYANIVKRRETYQRHIGKYPALAFAFFLTLLRMKRYQAEVIADNVRIVGKISFLFVGNNMYHNHRGVFEGRKSLGEHVLCVYILKTVRLQRLIKTAWHAMRGTIGRAGSFDISSARELEIRLKPRKIAVAFDGEVMHMRTPLHYAMHANGLKLLVSSHGELTSGHARQRKSQGGRQAH